MINSVTACDNIFSILCEKGLVQRLKTMHAIKDHSPCNHLKKSVSKVQKGLKNGSSQLTVFYRFAYPHANTVIDYAKSPKTTVRIDLPKLFRSSAFT